MERRQRAIFSFSEVAIVGHHRSLHSTGNPRTGFLPAVQLGEDHLINDSL
jgi:hypothetical protein